MWRFDQNFSRGTANQGDNQNGKGDSFTDLLCLLLERCSGKELTARPRVAGRIFRNHALDAAYPATGPVELLLETKVAGAPRNPRNPRQQNPLGRPGSADLDKRIKEAGLKTIDLKAEWARLEGRGGGPGADFITWLRRSKPACHLLLAVRVVDDGDLQRAVRTAEAANQVMDACGLFCYAPRADRYVTSPVPTHLEIDRVFSRVCDALRLMA
ncbi:MAG: hypothetical protein QN178_05575 [Armatimonadota bacterium]|nr:hypothetical protein [Armatimonadota bacterium]